MTLLIPTGWAQDDSRSAEEEAIPSARQNPILREHFREWHEFAMDRERVNPVFRERFIDHQIDRFLEQVEERLDAIREALSDLETAHRELAENSRPFGPARVRWSRGLREVEREAGRLRGDLSRLFRDLPNSSDFDAGLEAAEEFDFGEELDFLKKRFSMAEEEIRSYLFEPTHTVSVDGLQGQNMLIFLYELNRMSRELRNLL